MSEKLKLPSLDEISQLYYHSVHLVNLFDYHRWGKRITDKDAKFISDFHDALINLSNYLYRAHHENIPDTGPKHPEIVVDLIGQDGNAFNVLAIVKKAMKPTLKDAE